ncbi:patatin-like phospholipase family protein [Pseudomonas gingeri]|uniref:patatin-like phospholipase family protein n=1 Tax=Pseudomonas gingeri TaxID=117681 RepID=UPI0015A4B87D|nr:patatin-like phospholipase family protein [Pseudomonas gingeri]NWA05398.1 patatin-like phospholipase family protein [Pseudomonas gingeri]NWA17821.1 patatin-like phospholipase family protein [Pseudomonas gingeri]NWA57785.1 patatin-like phospholipase family protein [Pseudomonas gingeri]NWA98806.1 patatin-like phospholipase family protein [Pseudomonas gingeri]NWB05932.1 patatin-like phospholipase family protein [Pseudomonas gingeri]
MSETFKTGLVLSGGGAKGAYQVGVLKALHEAGARIDMISGASIGALNGGVLAGAPSLRVGIERLTLLWDRLAMESPLAANIPIYLTLLAAAGLRAQGGAALLAALDMGRKAADYFDLPWPESLASLNDGLLDDAPLKQLMDVFLESEGLDKGLPLYVSLYQSQGGINDLLRVAAAELGLADTPDSEVVLIQSLAEGERKQALLASAAIPLLFASRLHDGKRYSDGGQGGWQTVQGNTPIAPLLEAGCNLVIVTHLSEGSAWSRQRFPDATVLEIRPSRSLERTKGWFSGPRDLLGFHPEKIPSWIEQGYQDTLGSLTRVLEAQKSRNKLRASEAALTLAQHDAEIADDVLARAMKRLS